MKRLKGFLAVALSFSLYASAFLNFTAPTAYAQQQDSKVALQRGYRTGYSDGYMSGYRDTIDNAAKNYGKHGEYVKADRAFNKDYGSLEDYSDGYRQGFEAGYDTGFEKRSFDATTPINLNRRGASAAVVSTKTTTTTVTVEEPIAKLTEAANALPPGMTAVPVDVTVEKTAPAQPQQTAENSVPETVSQAPEATTATSAVNYNTVAANFDGSTVTIPTETELIVELIDDINTRQNRVGDKFTARIVSPAEVGGAIIEGRISKIQRPGRIKRRAEMLLSFDRIVLSNTRWSNFNAIVTEVLPVKGDNVKRVDTEGTVEGRRSYKEDSVKVGAATGTGLVVGAIAGGPVGAAVGASVGAAFGVGAVVIDRGKDIRLNKNQQIRIRTAYETQIR